jgi:cardiolipin synthase
VASDAAAAAAQAPLGRIDLRNHRKIVIIDGRVVFTGSQNLIHLRCRTSRRNPD